MNKVNILEVLVKRRSVRRYKPDPIPEKDLMTILEAGQAAPSACDRQSWRFIVVTDDSLKHELVNHGAAVFIKTAPVGILVLYDNRTQNIEYSDHIQSGAAAIQNMLLAASALGIGACWVCHLPPKRQLRKLFNIPWHMNPIAYVPLGYPKSGPPDRPRKCKVDNIISYNKYESIEQIPSRSIKILMRIIVTRLYYRLPIMIKKMLFPYIDKNFVKKFE